LVRNLGFERQIAKPPKKGKLKVLLIGNPTKDLEGAAREAGDVNALLQKLKKEQRIQEPIFLPEDKATAEAVAFHLAQSDILHYCGHAFFDGPEPGQSGLILANRVKFTGEDLRKIDRLPRMAFVNACEAGRVRGADDSKAAAFAELFLQSGIDAYLGTFWEVADAAASCFANTVYTQLALGKLLDEAVLEGRNKLFPKHPDWANYMLFGGATFRLVTE
jgi:CHAT domain-containing protein